jgi:hypothetical protein
MQPYKTFVDFGLFGEAVVLKLKVKTVLAEDIAQLQCFCFCFIESVIKYKLGDFSRYAGG